MIVNLFSRVVLMIMFSFETFHNPLESLVQLLTDVLTVHECKSILYKVGRIFSTHRSLYEMYSVRGPTNE